jgi:hypothetical protein
MYFAKLNLPRIPEEYITPCLANIGLIDTDPRLLQVNEYRGPANKATIIPKFVKNWLNENIFEPNIAPVPFEMANDMLNVTKYSEHLEDPEWYGAHGRHIDIGRNYALNYYFDLGGENTKIQWWSDNKETLLAETAIVTHQWYLLKVDTIHAVRNIEKDKLRIFVSAGFIGSDISKFNALVNQDSIFR